MCGGLKKKLDNAFHVFSYFIWQSITAKVPIPVTSVLLNLIGGFSILVTFYLSTLQTFFTWRTRIRSLTHKSFLFVSLYGMQGLAHLSVSFLVSDDFLQGKIKQYSEGYSK